MSTSSFNTKRRKDNKKTVGHKKAAAPSALTDDDDATKTTTLPRPNKKATLTFQEKIATAHAAKNAKRQKQMFMDVVLSKEFGTYKERAFFRSRDGGNVAFFDVL